MLSHYWGALANQTYAYKEKTVYSYDLKYWSAYEDADRRADTIYEENFRTGDVLVYSNSKDFTYQNTSGKNPAKRTYITRENGVYAYVFIEGRGFVGINFGADGAAGTRDDRHEFSPAYYTDNDFPLYSNPYENDEALLKFANYQTLFGKDCFVVLRPSLLLYPVPEPEPESEPEPSAEIAGDTESAEPVPGAGAEEAAAARDPRVAAAAFVLLLGAAFCLCIYVLLKCREKDRDGR